MAFASVVRAIEQSTLTTELLTKLNQDRLELAKAST